MLRDCASTWLLAKIYYSVETESSKKDGSFLSNSGSFLSNY